MLQTLQKKAFAIWGIGRLGKRCVHMLNPNNIACIIESDKSLIGTEYQGINIIDVKTYIKDFSSLPIIITPRFAEKEIKDFLHAKGIEHAFTFWDYLYDITGYTMQAPLKELYHSLALEPTIIIYGFSALSVIIYEDLQKESINCKIALPSFISSTSAECIKTKLPQNICTYTDIKDNSVILLSQPLVKEEELYLSNKKVKYKTLYDLCFHKELYNNRALEKYKNLHSTERCFIVATGPSLKIDDLDRLYEHNEICISMNGILKAFSHTTWRPNYYFVQDLLPALEWKNEILSSNIEGKLIADGAWCFEKDDYPDMHKWHIFNEPIENKNPTFGDDFTKGFYSGVTVTYSCIQFAIYAGFKQIYLLGVDNCNYLSHEAQHFVKDYEVAKGMPSLNAELANFAYRSAKNYAAAHEIHIYNATRGGALEEFERVDFDSLFPNLN